MNSNDEQLTNNFILLRYQKAIYKFEKNLEEIYSDNNINNNKEYEGHLINLKDYEGFIKKIDYEKNKNSINNSVIDENISDSEKIYTIKQIEFITSQYLLNMIYNDNKYIIINNGLWEILCNKGEENKLSIKFEIKPNYITLKLIDGKKLVFSNYSLSKNIIIERYHFSSTYSDIHNTSNYDEIKNIYNIIEKYYNFEKKFLKDLKNSKYLYQDYGYFVDKNWIDEWKLYSNYEEIKINYLDKNIEEKNIKDQIIYYQEKYKYIYSKLNKIEIINFSKKEEFENILKTKSLALLNYDFIYPITDYNRPNSIYYQLSNNKIEIIFDYKSSLVYQIDSNIISLNKDNNNDFLHLKQLIKIFYFKEYFNKIINSPQQYLEKEKIESNKIVLINKKMMNKYKEFFNYNILYTLLKII